MEEKVVVEHTNHKPEPNDNQLKPHEVREIRDHLRKVREDERHDHPHPQSHDHNRLPDWMKNPLSFIGMVALWTLIWMILFTLAFVLSSKPINNAYTKTVPVYVR